MKTGLKLLLILILLTSKVFAYTQSPIYSINEYKKEINKTIKQETKKAKKSIDKIKFGLIKEKNNYIKPSIVEQEINASLFSMYMELINTTNKYIEIKKDIPITDNYDELAKIIIPVLKSNDIDISKINKTINYASKKQFEYKKDSL